MSARVERSGTWQLLRAGAFDLACAFVALLLALVIYRGWRQGMWIHRPSTFVDASLTTFARAHPLPDWVRFSLPDALWQYAFVAAMLAMWRGEPWHRRKIAFVAAPVLFGCAIEIGQGLGWIEGVFDPVDLLASVIAGVVGVALHGDFVRRRLSRS